MVKQLITIRIEKPILDQLRIISKDLRWPLAKTIRYLIEVSFVMLYPLVRLNSNDLIKFIKENTDEKGYINSWKIVEYISPRAANQIAIIEEKLKKDRLNK